jgi:hypothetical protein
MNTDIIKHHWGIHLGRAPMKRWTQNEGLVVMEGGEHRRESVCVELIIKRIECG